MFQRHVKAVRKCGNFFQVMSFVKGGGRLEKPQFCPDEMLEFIIVLYNCFNRLDLISIFLAVRN